MLTKLDLKKYVKALRSLSGAAKRKHPVLTEAAERGIQRIRSSSHNKVADKKSSAVVCTVALDDVLQPFILTCNHTNISPKIVDIALTTMQRLIINNKCNSTQLRNIIRVVNLQTHTPKQEIQIKILQTVPLLIDRSGAGISQDLMCQAFGICFRLMDTKSSMIRNTAMATLRQIICLLFDCVEKQHADNAQEKQQTNAPTTAAKDASSTTSAGPGAGGGSSGIDDIRLLPPATASAGLLFHDLCQIGLGREPPWLPKLKIFEPTYTGFHKSMPFTIIELLQSIVNAHHELLATLPQLLVLVRHSLYPLLITHLRSAGPAQSRSFAMTQHVASLVELLAIHFTHVMPSECATLLSLLTRSALPSEGPDAMTCRSTLVLNTIHALSKTTDFAVVLFRTSDMLRINEKTSTDTAAKNAATARNRDEQEARGLTALVIQLSRFITKHIVHLAQADINAAAKNYRRRKQLTMSWQAAEHVDSRSTPPEPPNPAELVLLGVDCIVHFITSFSSSVDAAQLDTLTDEQATRTQYHAIRTLWAPALPSLDTVLKKCAEEEFVQRILKGYEVFTGTCGRHAHTQARNKFLQSLCGVALPNYDPMADRDSRLVASINSLRPKHIQALKTMLNIAHNLGNRMDHTSWPMLFEVFEQLHTMLTSQKTARFNSELSILSDALGRLFVSSCFLSDDGLSKMMQSLAHLALTSLADHASTGRRNRSNSRSANASPTAASTGTIDSIRQRAMDAILQRREASTPSGTPSSPPAIDTSRPSFALEKLCETAKQNVFRINIFWSDLLCNHLKLFSNSEEEGVRAFVVEHSADLIVCALAYKRAAAPSPSKKSSRTTTPLNNPLMSPRSLEFVEDYVSPSNMQVELLSLLLTFQESKWADVRLAGLAGLLKLLRECGQLLKAAWKTALNVMRRAATSLVTEVRMGFKSIALVADEFLSFLKPQDILDLMDSLCAFVTQRADVNTSLTAITTLWSITDFIKQTTNPAAKLAAPSPEGAHPEALTNQHASNWREHAPALWTKLLNAFTQSAHDPRPDVRNSACNTLVSAISSNGDVLGESWKCCMMECLLPLLESTQLSGAQASKQKGRIQGDELGTQMGERVHMVVHHSRNTEAKQWNETIVIAMQGVARVVQRHFQHIQRFPWVRQCWSQLVGRVSACLLHQEGGAKASEEVELAALTVLRELLQFAVVRGGVEGGTVTEAEWDGMFDSVMHVCAHLHENDALILHDQDQKVVSKLAKHLQAVYVSTVSHSSFWTRPRLHELLQVLFNIKCKLLKQNADARGSRAGHAIANERLSPYETTYLQLIDSIPAVDDASIWSLIVEHLGQYIAPEDLQLQKKTKAFYIGALESLHRLFSKYCDKPLVQPRLFARVISVLAATLRRPVRVQDDLGDDSVAQIREVAVNTLVQVISFAGAMAGIQKLSTDEQGKCWRAVVNTVECVLQQDVAVKVSAPDTPRAVCVKRQEDMCCTLLHAVMQQQALFNEEVTQQLSRLLFVSASDRKDHRQRLATEATSALFLLAAANRPVTQSQHAIPYVLALCDADLRALPVTKLEALSAPAVKREPPEPTSPVRIVATVEEAIRRHSARLSRTDLPDTAPAEVPPPAPAPPVPDAQSVASAAHKVLESRVEMLLVQLESLRVNPAAMKNMRTRGAGLPDAGLASPARAVALGGERAHLLHLLPALSECVKCDSATVRDMLAGVIGEVATTLCLSRDSESSGPGHVELDGVRGDQIEMEY